MDVKTFLSMLVRTGLKALAGFLIGHGYLQASGTEAFIGAGMAVAAALWSFWNDYGAAILKAELDMLKARVQLQAAGVGRMNQAAQGKMSATSPASAPTASPPKSAAIILALAGTLALSLLLPGAAYAQNGVPRPRAVAPPTGNPITDIGNAIKGRQQAEASTQNADTEDLVAKLGKLALPDFEFALALSKATNNVVSTPCWSAWVDLLSAQQKPLMGPGAPLTNPDGTPQLDATGKPILGPPVAMNEPDPHLATSVEKISELLAALRPDSTLSTGCAALAAAGGKDAATLIQGILSGGALGLFKLPVPIGPIP
jgi:hypothetical protein